MLGKLLDEQLAAFQANAAAATALLAVGESPHDASRDATELAAWTMLASAVLNLDEAVTR